VAVAESVLAEWRRLRETNPRAGGVGVDRMLGVETPAEPAIARTDGPPIKLGECVRETLRREQEQTFAEVRQEQQSEDFLTRLSAGLGSRYPSGRAGNGDL
jgi:hypothetical protein